METINVKKEVETENLTEEVLTENTEEFLSGNPENNEFADFDDIAEAETEETEREKQREKDAQLPPDPDAILEVRHLKKYFVLKKTLMGKPLSTLKAVDDVSFKVKQGETVELDEETESVFYDEHTPETKMLEKERSQKLLEEINALGEPNASIIKYKYYYGMTAKEIGKKIGLSKNAVEKRVKRCHQTLSSSYFW